MNQHPASFSGSRVPEYTLLRPSGKRGVGLGVVSYLRAHLGDQSVTPYDFSHPKAKAQLGSAFLALIETNRFKYFSDDQCDAPSRSVAPEPSPAPLPASPRLPVSPSPCLPVSASPRPPVPLSDSWWFFQQATACAYEIPPEGTLDANLRWGVPASHRTETPAGPQPTHDDRLLSAALIAELDRLTREGRVALGLARSAVIPAPDPLAHPVY
ncbi:MAG TPA: hypothetical protein PKO09_17635 [Anaerolineae bacterium]|nr:hypothetical protein [Anaerolineae bacterium]